jgi:uncharacterized membrane protein
MNALPAHVLLSRRLTVWSLLALIVLCLAWELAWAPLRPGGSWLVLKALPLCLPLAGLLRHRMYTYRWLSLFIWFYFTEGVVRATTEPAPSAWLAGLEVLLSLLIFVGCVMHVRMRFRSARAQAMVSPNS